MLSDVMEDYLKAIFTLQMEHSPPISTSLIADHLEVTPPTVTSMMEKLEERGLVTREKYKGVELTEEGTTVALEVIRHHRLIEAYLAEHLDYEWSEVHDEADVLEHHISEEFERRVAETLDEPSVDPHGDPIPDENLESVPEDDTVSLSEVESGQTVLVCRVRDRDADELAYLSEIGVVPGKELDVEEVTAVGMYRIRVDDRVDHLPESVARTVSVRPISNAEPAGSRDDPNGVSTQ
ncbi:MAG: metal-dependent transcriptional regulator [Halodesulfurarchaeum sp.]